MVGCCSVDPTVFLSPARPPFADREGYPRAADKREGMTMMMVMTMTMILVIKTVSKKTSQKQRANKKSQQQ